MIWITADDVIFIHSRIIKTTGGMDVLRDRSTLEAGLAAPLQSFDGKNLYETDLDNCTGGLWTYIQLCIYRWK